MGVCDIALNLCGGYIPGKLWIYQKHVNESWLSHRILWDWSDVHRPVSLASGVKVLV